MKRILLGFVLLAAAVGLGIAAYRAMTVEVPVDDQA
jgi:hypothetical protein